MSWPICPLLGLTFGMLGFGCVPRGTEIDEATRSEDPLASSTRVPRWRPRPTPHFAVEGTNDGGAADRAPSVDMPSSPKLTDPYRDEFERSVIGSDWHVTAPRWTLDGGRLCGQSAKNHPIWLKRRLPLNARISYTARSHSPDGDIKVELWGNGTGFATSASYSNATSYIFIFGGWRNQQHVLARLNEHGTDRLSLELSDGTKDAPFSRVVQNQDYTFTIERRDGHTVTVAVDGTSLFTYDDPSPLTGATHDHFAFNNWDARVCFDHLVITPLAE